MDKKKSQHQASPQNLTPRNDNPSGATKLWRFNIIVADLQTITVVADTEEQARKLITAAAAGVRHAKERVTFHPLAPSYMAEYPPRCADFATEPVLATKLQQQRVRLTGGAFQLDFEGGGGQ